MVVTDIIEVTKAKSRVFLDGEFAFVLYKGELRLYKLRKDEEVSERTVEEINKTLPTYKYIKHMILTDKELIKTTTKKIKRNEEMRLMEQ